MPKKKAAPRAARSTPAPKKVAAPPADPAAAALARIRAAGGKAALLSAGALSDVKEVVPSGISVVDYHLLGVGGLAAGRMTELFGDEGTGKTSLMFSFMAGCQLAGGVVRFSEAEHALESARADVFGVDRERVLFDQPCTLEEALQGAEEFMQSMVGSGVGPNLWCYDSLAAGTPAAELEGDIGDAHVAAQARLLSPTLRRLLPLAVRSRTAILVLNQTRTKIGVMFGNPTTTTGGNALKFYCSARLSLMGGTPVKDGETTIGKDVVGTCVKTKVVGGKPFAKARLRLLFEHGWDERWTLLNHAKDRKLVAAGARGEKFYREALSKLGWKEPVGASEVDTSAVESEEEILRDMGQAAPEGDV